MQTAKTDGKAGRQLGWKLLCLYTKSFVFQADVLTKNEEPLERVRIVRQGFINHPVRVKFQNSIQFPLWVSPGISESVMNPSKSVVEP